MNEEETKENRRRKSLNVTFDKFKYDIDNVIDDKKKGIIHMEEVQEDLKHCYRKYCIATMLY